MTYIQVYPVVLLVISMDSEVHVTSLETLLVNTVSLLSEQRSSKEIGFLLVYLSGSSMVIKDIFVALSLEKELLQHKQLCNERNQYNQGSHRLIESHTVTQLKTCFCLHLLFTTQHCKHLIMK